MSLPSPVDLLRAAAAVALAAGVAWIGYAVAVRLVAREARTSARLSAAAIVAAWLPIALFWLLTPFGGFRLVVILPVIALGTVVAMREASTAEWREARAMDCARLRRVAGELARHPAGWALVPVLGTAAVQWVRGTAAPPLGWDALTYHLYRAGRWVQHGSLAPQPAPDAWSYYEYFPVVGDAFWSWAMLPLRSDALITTAGLGVWGALLLGVYAAARELGAPPERSALAGAAVGFLPSVIPFLSSAYVDNAVAALFALGNVFVLRSVRRRELAEAPLAAGAFGLMLGAKPTTAGLFALGALVVVTAVVAARASGRARRLALLACVLAAVVGYPGYQRAWVEGGSPLHPFTVSFGPVVLAEGVEASRVVMEELAARAEAGEQAAPGGPVRSLVWEPQRGRAFLNPGIGAVVLVLLGMLGLPTLLRRPGRRVEALYLAGSAVVVVLVLASSGMALLYRTTWVANVGRYAVPGFVALAVLGAAWTGGRGRKLAIAAWLLALAPGIVLARPRGLVREELAPDLAVLGIAAVTVLAVTAVLRRGGVPTVARLAAAGLAAALALAAIGEVRRAHRYPLYRAAVDSRSPIFHMHPLSAGMTAAWPIWRELDRPAEGADAGGWPARRIAVTAGWDGLGHNWYRYPLLGSRLQNDVLYVPVTGDGSIVDYRERDELARRSSSRAWIERLVAERVDEVVSLAPRNTVEDAWMRSSPELFTPTVVVAGDFHALYRFDRAAAAAALARTRAAAPGGPAQPPGRPPPRKW